MDDIGQLRIYVSEKHFNVYHKISGNQVFKQNSEFFLLCAFAGEKNNLKSPLEKRQELCRAITLTDYDKSAIKALYLKNHGKLSTFKEMVRYTEELANAGFEWLLDDVLVGMTIQDGNEKWDLKQGTESELQLALMRYVLKEKQEVPF